MNQSRTVPKAKITNFTETELKDWSEKNNQPGYRTKQLYNWLYQRGEFNLEKMNNISKEFRSLLNEYFCFEIIPINKTEISSDGTVKFLQILEDGHKIESVLLKHDDHYTVCLSTQVGCALACKFCLTAKMGFIRNLTAGEIVEQVINAKTLISPELSIRNLVYMGMGEPFNNYENTMKSLEIFLNPAGFDFSSRRITISTSGLVDKIEQFGHEKIKANLAISLNAVTQEGRQSLMPISKRYNLTKLLDTCRNFPKESRKRITFEFIMIKDITDTIEIAKKLVKILHGIKSKINLILLNEHPDIPYQSPEMEQVKKFQRYLLDHGLLATLRTARGNDISAACGQLATEKKNLAPI